MKINTKNIAVALAASQLLFSSELLGNNWTTGAQIPFSPSTGLFGRFEACVYNPATGQIIQTWQDLGSAGHFLYSSAFNGENWITVPIPPGTSVGASNSNEFYSPVYNPGAGQLVQVWQDTLNAPHGLIYYSAFNGTSWSTGVPIPLGSSAGVADFNNPIYYSPSNQLIEIWLDSSNSFFYYSVNDGSGWTPGVEIPPGSSTGSPDSFESPIFMPSTGQLVQIWQDSTNGFFYYSVYNGTNWTAGAEIPPGTSTGVGNYNNASYDPATGQIVQVWGDTGSGFLFYSAYNGQSWTPGAEIPPGTSTGITAFLPSPVYVPSTKQLVQIWQDAAVGNFAYYSAYDGISWTIGAQIPPGSSTRHSGANVAYDSATGQLIHTWSDITSTLLYYSAYNGSSWTTGAQIPLGQSTGIHGILGPIYDSSTGQLVFVWQDVGAGNFMYSSSYNGTSWTPGVEINPGTSSGVTGFNVPVAIPSTNQLITIWRNSVGPSFFLYYSTY